MNKGKTQQIYTNPLFPINPKVYLVLRPNTDLEEEVEHWHGVVLWDRDTGKNQNKKLHR